MSRITRRRSLLAAALLVIVAAAIAVFFGLARHERDVDAFSPFRKGESDAQATVARGVGNGQLGGPEGATEEQLAALAYPSNTLPASLLANERSFFTGHVKGRNAFHGNGGWQLVGPTTATEPSTLNFFDLNASDLQESGRVTAIAVAPSCNANACRIWVAAAGGGIWRSDNALAPDPNWKNVSAGFVTNAVGALTYDAATNTLYAGTGEPNASGDSEAGVGIYASHDNGNTWTFLPGSLPTMAARSISSIVIDPRNPRTLYVGTTRGVRGVTSVTGGAVSLAPDAAPWGLYKTTDGGNSFSEVWDGAGSPRGVNHVELDAHGVLYAAAFGRGVWRSPDGGSSWEQVFATKDVGDASARTEFALNTTPDGHTRIYVGDGGTGPSNTGVYRGDAIDTKPGPTLVAGGADTGYVSLTSPNRSDPKWATSNYCEGQCWYDNFVVSPAGHPDMVYVGGSFDYDLYFFSDAGKAVLLSQDAGATWTDQTRDAQSASTGIHPDQHALAVDPANPLLFFEGSDGGMVRSSGQLADNTASCTPGYGSYSDACFNLEKAVPTKLTTLNQGLSTLQFQNAVASPTTPGTIIGGTQDNGTWLGTIGNPSWSQTIYGDGGVAAFDAKSSTYALNEFYGQYTDGNFENGDPTKWVILSAPFFASNEASAFYKPQIGDPVSSGTFFVGLQSVWRTQDFGGDKTQLEQNCQEFTTPGDQPGCGDFVALGDASGHGGPGSSSDLTSSTWGDRAGGYVVALARTPADRSTLWTATATGRVFVSRNADAAAGSVTFKRIDGLSPAAPNRFVSGIVVDPTNPNRAWITYTGYNANTPATPGHVFQVVYDPTAGTATWTDIDNGSGPLGDLPVTGIARDDATGTLYVSTDFTVLADAPAADGSFDGNWRPAAGGMPFVEVAGVTIDPTSRTLFAATHGRGIWSLALPPASGPKRK